MRVVRNEVGIGKVHCPQLFEDRPRHTEPTNGHMKTGHTSDPVDHCESAGDLNGREGSCFIDGARNVFDQ